ncbi:MAG: hypothetical protein JSW08_00280 [archaeon]|nr:MAG: hypothetical protein JSW08_00280 [archaeon]
MKIFIACSKHFYDKVLPIKEELEKNGHQIAFPNNFEDPFIEERLKGEDNKKHREWKAGMLLKDKTNLEPVDAILVLNFEKNGEPNYIGGATFLEAYKAWELNKKIFLFNDIPNNIFKDELEGLNPVILKGDLSKIKNDTLD